jgi:tetratricopeptide (TPR) repeat protein
MNSSKSKPEDTLTDPPANRDAVRTFVDSTLVTSEVPSTGVRGPVTLESPGQKSSGSGSDDSADKRQVGRFEIEQLLGRGGQGKVWLAQDPLLGRRVAIKQLPKGTELTEARLAAAIEHPNVCRVYDFLSTDEHDFIVMEYVGGETLLKAKRRGLKLEEGLRVLWQVSRGLAAAHERGVVHRDLKADNVLLTPFGVAKITDFGISRRESEPASSEASLTGTPHSMSPEQSLGQATDARSDLFSFGVLCHEVITGESPFLGRDLYDTLHRVRALTPPALHELEPNVPRSLSQLVQRLLAKSPADRETSAEKVALALQAIIDQSDRTSALPGTGRGERRQVVLVACELTLAPGREDPELLLQFRQPYRRTVERVVDELGGSVHVAVGQQYVLCFGYPEPHEDSGRRAARAALSIKDWADAVGSAGGVTVRAAVHAGTAVILEQGQGSELELGNLLRTVQGLRELSSEAAVVVSDAGCEVLHGGVELGEQTSVALAGSVQLYRPLLRLGLPRRLRHALPLIGRQAERSLLVRACQRATQASGKLVLLQGEPGIGKSRLLQDVRDEQEGELRWAVVRATQDTTHTPFAPIADLLGELLGMAGALGDERLSRAHGRLQSFGIPPEDVLPYFDSLLRLPASERALPPAWESPERRREATLAKLVNLLQRYTEKTPLAVVLEDAHWADASTLELLERLAPRLGNMRLLLLVSARTEFARSALSGPNVSVLQLGALSAEESLELVTSAGESSGISPALVQSIVARGEGVPLFLEHVARTLKPALGDASSSNTHVPSSLRDLFAAQLHRAGADRAPLEVAAVIGREFEVPLLCRAARLTEPQASQLLSRLASQGLIELAGGASERETWQFRHALIRDAAYESMLRPRRQLLHAEVLEGLCGALPQREHDRPELLARHAEGAGALERALELWLRAAGRCATRYALREADEAYAECLRILPALPHSAERDARELEILAARGAIQQALYGYAAEPVVTTYARADELCQSLDTVPFPVIRGVWNVHVIKGDKPATLKYAERISGLLSAERLGRLDRSMAHNCLGTFHWFTGEWQRCLHHYEAAAYQTRDHAAMVATYGGCGGAYARILSPYARAVLGSLERARRESAEVVAAMSALDDPFSQAMAMLYDVMLERELGDLERASAAAGPLLELCQEHGFAQLLPLAAITVAAGKVHHEKDLASLKAIGDSLTLLGAVGARTPAAYWLAWLAEALLSVGAAADALGAVEHGLGASATGLDHFYDAELHRLKALAFQALGKPDAEISAAFEQSLSIAREREHALFELKTAADFGDFMAKRGDLLDAQTLLKTALAKVDGFAPIVDRAMKLRASL